MDDTSYCAGKCKDPAIQAADGSWLCRGCGLMLETRKAKCRTVVVYASKNAPAKPSKERDFPASVDVPQPRAMGPGSGERIPAVTPAPAPVQSVPCTTCRFGEIGVARWLRGVDRCTTCQPVQIVAIGLNKAAEVFQLEATPEEVASGRRRP